jgi:hypothetical protein
MRRVAIGAVVLLCLTVLLAGSGATAQRVRVTDVAATRTPTQVQVTNFPTVQTVSGAVNVANLPAVQEVAGTVNVGNFPAAAPITVNVVTPTIHFAGFTVATLSPTGDASDPGFGYAPQVLDLNRACHAEFPGSRACILEEIGLLTPPPMTWPDRAWDLEHGVGPTNPNVILLWAGCRYANGSYTTRCGGGPSPVACCAY